MAMQVGSGGGDDEVMIDINTTPLIDVMLVLLVMLIITIPIQLHAVNLEMPVGTPPSDLIKPEKVQIDIDEKSTVYWQGLPVTAAELDEKMNLIAQLPQQPEVHIRGDDKSRYESVGRVIFACQRAGIMKINFVTEPPARGG
jgi:biopolymer transport protein ExbD